MSEESAIQQTINRYSEAASRAAWDEVMAVFMPDAIWEAAGQKLQGISNIKAAMQQLTAPMEYIVQMNCPAVITVNGNTATARSVIRELARMKGKDETFEILGFYSDKLSKTANGWQFSHRVFEIKGLNTYASKSGFPAA